MAICFLYYCECGKQYQFFVPKAKLVMTAGFDEAAVADAINTDRQEEADGEIASAREAITRIGSIFVDTRETPIVVCDCGKTIDSGEFVKMVANPPRKRCKTRRAQRRSARRAR